MKNFYDRVLPNIFKKIAKKLDKDAVLSTTNIKSGEESLEVFNVKISDAAKQSALEGQPLFSQQKKPTTGKGLTKEQAKKVTTDFVNKYKGVGDGLIVKIKTQKELSDLVNEKTAIAGKNLFGGYNRKSNTLYLVPENHATTDALKHTIQHELIVHKGIGFLPAKEKQVLIKSIADNAPKSRTLKDDWTQIEKDYPGANDLLKAEELLARLAERDLTTIKNDTFFDKIIAAIKRGLVKLGLIKDTLTKKDLLNVINNFAQSFAEGKKVGFHAAFLQDAPVEFSGPIKSETFFSQEEQNEYQQAIKKGLDMSHEARMQRAREMGFDTNTIYYHGTDQDFDAFDPGAKGGFSSSDTIGVITLTPHEDIAQNYAVGDAKRVGDTYKKMEYDDELESNVFRDVIPRVMALYVKGNIKKIDADGMSHNSRFMVEQQKKAREEGFDGIQFVGIADDTYYNPLGGSADTLQVFDPKNIRSIDAAFDPDYAEDSNLFLSQEEKNEYQQAEEKGLDMSHEARMQRAREMDFDTDTVYYHGGTETIDINRIFWGSETPELANEYSSLRAENKDIVSSTPFYTSAKSTFDADKLERTLKIDDFFNELSLQSKTKISASRGKAIRKYSVQISYGSS